uniref:Immunoglobulin domain-containing protein n=1 Tax=Fundulus heteroclitus TaxID=8078 RepID=A0A3Q2R144_FUNHE
MDRWNIEGRNICLSYFGLYKVLIVVLLLCQIFVSGRLFYTTVIQPNEEITLQCSNFSRAAGHIFWFKLAEGPNVSKITSMSISESVPFIYDGFKHGKFTMTSNSTHVFLNVEQLNVNDTGLYFCGSYRDKFPEVFTATYLHVQDQFDGSNNPLNWILGGLVIFLTMVIISLVVKIRALCTGFYGTNHLCYLQNLDSFTLDYAALSFPPKAESNRRAAAGREMEKNVLNAATR